MRVGKWGKPQQLPPQGRSLKQLDQSQQYALSASRDSKSTEAAGPVRGYLLLTTLELLALLEPTRVHEITCPVGYRGSISELPLWTQATDPERLTSP